MHNVVPVYTVHKTNLYAAFSILFQALLQLPSRFPNTVTYCPLTLSSHSISCSLQHTFTVRRRRGNSACDVRSFGAALHSELLYYFEFYTHNCLIRSTAARLLRSWVQIPPGAWMVVCCVCCVLSGRGFGEWLITRPEKSYRLVRRCV
jgi:hypothetical protein